MKIVHRIGLRATPTQRRELESLGVVLKELPSIAAEEVPLVISDVAEDHSSWPSVALLLREWRASDVPRTIFTSKELAAASWLRIAAWHNGYPQPADDDGYRRVTYDLTNWCPACGVGKAQSGPFRMSGEPRWGRRGIMQLIWVYDTLFVTPAVHAEIFDPAGIRCRPVLRTDGNQLKTVVQLVTEATVDVDTDGLSPEQCIVCNRTKYLPVARGRFPALKEQPQSAMVRSRQYFGSGAAANQLVIVSGALVKSLTAAEVRGAELQPCAEGP
jgi:hypothetical protein